YFERIYAPGEGVAEKWDDTTIRISDISRQTGQRFTVGKNDVWHRIQSCFAIVIHTAGAYHDQCLIRMDLCNFSQQRIVNPMADVTHIQDHFTTRGYRLEFVRPFRFVEERALE